ncbi:hypothetical protein C8R44DRAFT_835959 [Mycena epipterygia]|nr:hypothetical protein C8R44DRAFT_835959 [Mycena epipterygia]
MKLKYAGLIRDLADKENGWHFSAANTSAEQLQKFRIEDMALQMKDPAPELWDLLGLLLSANRRDADGDEPMDADAEVDKDPPTVRAQKLAEKHAALITIKKVVMISVMMQSTNKNCNALESVFGIFLHASNTPSKVIETLAHMGISISVDAIDDAHGVKPDDLRCSEELWAKNPLNPAFDTTTAPPPRTVIDLENLHPEADHPSQLTRRERFNSWLFRADLVKYGPDYFNGFSAVLGNPEMVEQVPVVKMRWAPARSLDIKQSTVAGNLQAIPEFLEQGGVGEPSQKIEGIWERNVLSIIAFVILFHGDLGTGERIMSLLQRRSIEDTPWNRYQYVIYIMGLFHLKMAAADAIWRIFIEPKSGDPGFRRMHDVIAHIGAALRLDAWRIEVLRRNPQWTTLQKFADSKPSFELITEISDYLASHYVAGAEDLNIFELRQWPVKERDQQHENVLQMHQYFALYEELSFAMNFGDIGRVETLFPPWIYIFKAMCILYTPLL